MSSLPKCPRYPHAPSPCAAPTPSYGSAPLTRSISSDKGRIAVTGTAGTNTKHTINEDERTSFTDHINGVLAGDPDVGHLLPIATDTMQLFDEVRGESWPGLDQLSPAPRLPSPDTALITQTVSSSAS